MPRRLTRPSALFFLLPLLLVGCAGAPRQQGARVLPRTPVQRTERIAYVIPKNAGIVEKGRVYNDSYRGISLGGPPSESTDDPRGLGSSRITNSVAVFHREMNVLEISRETVYQVGASSWRSYNKYFVEISVEDKPDRFVMTLAPKEHETRGDRSLVVKLPPPVFEEATLLESLSTGSVGLKFEIDAADGRDAVFSNFKRLLKGRDLSASGDARRGTFVLRKGSVAVETLTVECWPYKTGTKIVVEAEVRLYPTDTNGGVWTVDVKKIVDDAKRQIESVVKG